MATNVHVHVCSSTHNLYVAYLRGVWMYVYVQWTCSVSSEAVVISLKKICVAVFPVEWVEVVSQRLHPLPQQPHVISDYLLIPPQ